MKKLYIFIIFALISCSQQTGNDNYAGKPVYEGRMIFETDLIKLGDDYQFTINAKLKTLYKGHGIIRVVSIPTTWLYTGNDTTEREVGFDTSSIRIERNIELSGYVPANEFFSKQFVFKIYSSEIKNNKFKYQNFIEFDFRYDSVWDNIRNKMLNLKDYRDTHNDPDHILHLGDFTFPLNLPFGE